MMGMAERPRSRQDARMARLTSTSTSTPTAPNRAAPTAPALVTQLAKMMPQVH